MPVYYVVIRVIFYLYMYAGSCACRGGVKHVACVCLCG